MKTMRQRVEKKLGHNQFRLKYTGQAIWNIYDLTGKLLGFIFDRWPYFSNINAR